MEPEEHIDPNLEQGGVELERQLAEAKEEAQTNLAGWQRSQADFENYKKREETKQKEILEFAKEVTIVKLLPILDTLEQGLRHAPPGVDENWLRGIEGTLQKLDKTLDEMGVKKIEALGKQFDPNFHEAVREVPGDHDGLIVEDLQTGFEINGKVIRPSQVVISKKA
ncbi:MAG TPA: nucleotide exchange factor GrpE [Patescibacteria group bacterium]|jgi:molecular chaperone GrpE|nr:nucleotide exchange factor GrpE [Patescibacteria group bacterium]